MQNFSMIIRKEKTCKNSIARMDNIQIDLKLDSAGSVLSSFVGIYEYPEEYSCFIRTIYASIR
jgi:hypothetical protein